MLVCGFLQILHKFVQTKLQKYCKLVSRDQFAKVLQAGSRWANLQKVPQPVPADQFAQVLLTSTYGPIHSSLETQANYVVMCETLVVMYIIHLVVMVSVDELDIELVLFG